MLLIEYYKYRGTPNLTFGIVHGITFCTLSIQGIKSLLENGLFVPIYKLST